MTSLQQNNIKNKNSLVLWIVNLIIIYTTLSICWTSIFKSLNIIGLLIFFSLVSITLIITKDIYSLVYITLFILINNQLLTVNFKIESMYVSVKMITYLFVLICLLFLFFDGKFKKYSKDIMVTAPMYLVGYSYILFVNLINGSINIDFAISTLYFFTIGIIFQILVKSNKKYSRALLVVYFISISAMVLIGYIELLIGKTFFLSKWALEERYRYGVMRIGSTVADGNFMCLLLIPSYILFKSNSFSNVINKNIVNFFRVLIFIQVILTTSRTGLVVLLFAQFILYLHKYKHISVMFIPCFTMMIPFVNRLMYKLYSLDSGSNYARESMTELAHNIWINNLYFGIGFGKFTAISKNYSTGAIVDALQTMNTYYYILTASGIFGLLFYVSYIIISVKYDLINFFKDRESSYIVIAIITWSIMLYTLDAFYIIFLWIIPSIVMAIKIENENFIKNRNLNKN